MAALFGADDHRGQADVQARRLVGPAAGVRVGAADRRARRDAARAASDRLLAIKAEGEVTRALMQARCDRGAEIARLLGSRGRDGRGDPRARRALGRPRASRAACAARRSRCSGGSSASPRPPRSSTRTAASRPPGGSRRAAQRRLVRPRARRRVRRRLRRHGVLGDAARRATSRAWEPPDRVLTADDARLDAIAYAFAGVIDAKSPWTYRHSDRACVIVLGLAAALGADDADARDLRRAALLHDIGKLAISNRILDKPGRLTDARVRADPRAPASSRGRSSSACRASARSRRSPAAHHERLDGSGYPHGLAGDELTMPMRAARRRRRLRGADRPSAPTARRCAPRRRSRSSAPGRRTGSTRRRPRRSRRSPTTRASSPPTRTPTRRGSRACSTAPGRAERRRPADQTAAARSPARGAAAPATKSAERSPIMIDGAFVLPVATVGMIDASATRRPSTPPPPGPVFVCPSTRGRSEHCVARTPRSPWRRLAGGGRCRTRPPRSFGARQPQTGQGAAPRFVSASPRSGPARPRGPRRGRRCRPCAPRSPWSNWYLPR